MTNVKLRYCAMLSMAPICQSWATPPLLPNEYARVSGAAPFPAIQITTTSSGGSVVTMHNPNYSGPSCTGSLDIMLQYTTPANYKGDAIDFSAESCSGEQKCGGVVFKCNGIGHEKSAAIFLQPEKNTVTINTQLWGGVSTFRSNAANDQSASDRNSMRKAAVPRFETIRNEAGIQVEVLTEFK